MPIEKIAEDLYQEVEEETVKRARMATKALSGELKGTGFAVGSVFLFEQKRGTSPILLRRSLITAE